MTLSRSQDFIPQAYFNEHDPPNVQWLRNLADAGMIPAGVFDGRDIQEVRPDDVRSFLVCHWFAGIGGWPLALSLAGWDPTLPVWTASCPCQPFSTAGKGKGKSDSRHLWPVLRELIAECRPAVLFGEQVASKLGREWLAGVRADLEALGYRFGAADLCAASAGEKAEGWVRRGDQIRRERIVLGAPHIRQRLYWVADTQYGARREFRQLAATESEGVREVSGEGLGFGLTWNHSPTGGLGDTYLSGRRAGGQSEISAYHIASHVPVDRMEYAQGDGRLERRSESGRGSTSGGRRKGPWSDFDLVDCLDNKTRRIEPGSQCLVDGVPFRLADGRSLEGVSRSTLLKGFGNAIVPELAAEFIKAFLDTEKGMGASA